MGEQVTNRANYIRANEKQGLPDHVQPKLSRNKLPRKTGHAGPRESQPALVKPGTCLVGRCPT